MLLPPDRGFFCGVCEMSGCMKTSWCEIWNAGTLCYRVGTALLLCHTGGASAARPPRRRSPPRSRHRAFQPTHQLPPYPPANLSSDWQETVCRVWGPGQDKEAAQLMYVWQCGNLVLASPHRCTVANSESSQSRASHSLFRLKERYGIINSRPAKKLTVRPHGPPCFGINNSDLSN